MSLNSLDLPWTDDMFNTLSLILRCTYLSACQLSDIEFRKCQWKGLPKGDLRSCGMDCDQAYFFSSKLYFLKGLKGHISRNTALKRQKSIFNRTVQLYAKVRVLIFYSANTIHIYGLQVVVSILYESRIRTVFYVYAHIPHALSVYFKTYTEMSKTGFLKDWMKN